MKVSVKPGRTMLKAVGTVEQVVGRSAGYRGRGRTRRWIVSWPNRDGVCASMVRPAASSRRAGVRLLAFWGLRASPRCAFPRPRFTR